MYVCMDYFIARQVPILFVASRTSRITELELNSSSSVVIEKIGYLRAQVRVSFFSLIHLTMNIGTPAERSSFFNASFPWIEINVQKFHICVLLDWIFLRQYAATIRTFSFYTVYRPDNTNCE